MITLPRAGVVFAALVVASSSSPCRAQVQPEARAAFARMASALEEAGSFSVRAWIAYDVVQPNGQKLQFQGSADLQLERPGRLHAQSEREGARREIWLRDGRIDIADLGENTWAQADGPPTVDGMLDLLAETYGFSMPLADLLYSEVDEAVLATAQTGEDLGTVDVQGVRCRHLAFRHPKVDWQVWLEEGPRALPRRVVITYKQEEGQPQYSADLWDWNLGAQLPPTLFVFVPPPGAEQVALEPVPAPASGRRR